MKYIDTMYSFSYEMSSSGEIEMEFISRSLPYSPFEIIVDYRSKIKLGDHVRTYFDPEKPEYGYGMSDTYDDAILIYKNLNHLEFLISKDNKYNNGLFSLLKEGKLDVELNQHRSMATHQPVQPNILTRLLTHKQTKNVRHNSHK